MFSWRSVNKLSWPLLKISETPFWKSQNPFWKYQNPFWELQKPPIEKFRTPFWKSQKSFTIFHTPPHWYVARAHYTIIFFTKTNCAQKMYARSSLYCMGSTPMILLHTHLYWEVPSEALGDVTILKDDYFTKTNCPKISIGTTTLILSRKYSMILLQRFRG